MSLTVHNAHNGLTTTVSKPVRYLSFQDFKLHLVESFSNYILDDANNVFLLTQFGMRVDYSIINELTEIYFFDKRLFVHENPSIILTEYATQTTKEIPPPKRLLLDPYSRLLTIRQMSSSLRSNAGWAMSVKVDSVAVGEQISAYKRQISIMFRCLSIMFEFIAGFTAEIEKSFTKFYNHINQLSLKTLHKEWRMPYKELSEKPPFTFKNGKTIRLAEMLSPNALQAAAESIETNLLTVIDQFNRLSSTINEVNSGKTVVDSDIQALRDESIADFAAILPLEPLLEDIASFALSLSNTNLGSDSQDLADLYAQHFELSHNLDEKFLQLHDSLAKLTSFKQKLAKKGTELFQYCARLQMQMVDVKVAMNEFDSRKQESKGTVHKITEIKQNEEYLSLTTDLPLLFGFAIIEMRRQYEWYDFFASGAVNNVTEQLQTIINQERLFRKLWAKKIGSFLSVLECLPAELSQTLPSLDMTIVKGREDFFSKFLVHEVQREDIGEYITWVKTVVNNNNFASLLERNFADLIKSTNAMKQVTRAIGSLSSYTSPENTQEPLFDERRDDHDLIQGYKSRIRKLENLVHQQQFKDLSTWPVTKGGKPDQSMIFNPRRSMSGGILTQGNHDGNTLLLKRRSSLGSQQISADDVNQELMKENQDLLNRLRELQVGENSSSKLPAEAEVTGTKILARQNSEISAQNKDLERENSSQRSAIEALKEEAAEKDSVILKLKQLVEELNGNVKRLQAKNELLESSLEEKNKHLEETASQQEATAKKLESERSRSSKLASDLRDADTYSKNQLDSDQLVADLALVAADLYCKLVDHTRVTYDYVLTLSYILEKMGLMLTKEEGDSSVFKIRRVKGLRSRRASNDSEYHMGSPVVAAIRELMTWSYEHIVKHENDEGFPQRLVELCRELSPKLDRYTQVVGFRTNVSIEQVSDHDLLTIEFFLNAVTKRFKDVEGLAKKLAKEKKSNENDVQKLIAKMSTKVTLSNFKTGDLALFLPTRLEAKDGPESAQPWTAFNIGSPHYFMKTPPSGDREWAVARIVSIVEHTVISSTKGDVELNPHRLSEGITWYLVEAKEIGEK